MYFSRVHSNIVTSAAIAAIIMAPSPAMAVDTMLDPALNEQLELSSTALQRLALLPEDSNWKFDFTKQPFYTFSPGGVVNSNAATFPATVGNELTMAMLNLGPCSMLPPHYHPRGTNYVVAVLGNTTTYMIQENGARMVTETLLPGQMTIFPRGSTHAMQNNGCTNAQLISALSSTDAGTQNLVNGLFQFPDNFIQAAFGNPSNGVVFDSQIPPVGTGSVVGDLECLARCNIS